MTEDYRIKAKAIFEKYRPMEVASDITEEERLKYMIEWWTNAHTLMLEHNVTRPAIADAWDHAHIELREYVDSLIELSHQADIPFLVFSAGVADIIEVGLERLKLDRDNVHVISNHMKWDEKDSLVGFSEPLVHVMCKNYSVVEGSDFYHQTQSRRNVLLMGDNLGDHQMANGVGDGHTVLRIAFLTDHLERLPAFKENFDIILMNDISFEQIYSLVSDIVGKEAAE
jgi:7-methylguanosine nucleotidase